LLISRKPVQRQTTWRAFECLVIATLVALIFFCGVAMVVYPTSLVSSGPLQSAVLLQQNQKVMFYSAKKPRNFWIDSLGVTESAAWVHGWRGIEKIFKKYEYQLDQVTEKKMLVPRVFFSSLPRDLKNITDTKFRKHLFLMIILPLILKENEKIQEDRARLWEIIARKRMGEHIFAQDRLWLAVLAESFKVDRNDLSSLLMRVDIIPASLALAQAAEESGWGTSRFATSANAVFGQWTTKNDSGVVPLNRDIGKTHKVKRFESLSKSISAYMRNLNTHPAYRSFRKTRSVIRKSGSEISGMALVSGLKKYSQRGQAYIKILQKLILSNDLHSLDNVTLEKRPSQS